MEVRIAKIFYVKIRLESERGVNFSLILKCFGQEKRCLGLSDVCFHRLQLMTKQSLLFDCEFIFDQANL